MKGKLIVFEGPDGVGKTTLSKFAASFMEEKDFPCYCMSFPGKEEGTLGNVIYKIHHAPSDYDINTITPTAKQALHIAAHLDSIESKIVPMLSNGINVVLDRFWWSTWVYGINSGLSEDVLNSLIQVERALWLNYMPSLLFLVKADAPRERDEDILNWQRLKSSYDDLAASEEDLYTIKHLGNNGYVWEATNKVKEAILTLL